MCVPTYTAPMPPNAMSSSTRYLSSSIVPGASWRGSGAASTHRGYGTTPLISRRSVLALRIHYSAATQYVPAMLLLTAFIEIDPRDREVLRPALSDVIAATRLEEGCAEYGCYEDTQAPGRYVFVERWRDKAALDRHLATPHMAAWMQAARGVLTSATGTLFDVAGQKSLRP